jgi:hypothetical protein
VVDAQEGRAVAATVGAGIAIVGTFLPWLRSGSRNRSSYTIFDLVERLGFAPSGVVSWSLRLWPIVPMLLVLDVVAVWVVTSTGKGRRSLLVTTGVIALWVAGTAVAVRFAPDAGLFRIGVGPLVTVGGVVGLVVGVALISCRGSGASAAS